MDIVFFADLGGGILESRRYDYRMPNEGLLEYSVRVLTSATFFICSVDLTSLTPRQHHLLNAKTVVSYIKDDDHGARLRAADIFRQHGDTKHALNINRSVLNSTIVSRSNHKVAAFAICDTHNA